MVDTRKKYTAHRTYHAFFVTKRIVSLLLSFKIPAINSTRTMNTAIHKFRVPSPSSRTSVDITTAGVSPVNILLIIVNAVGISGDLKKTAVKLNSKNVIILL